MALSFLLLEDGTELLQEDGLSGVLLEGNGTAIALPLNPYGTIDVLAAGKFELDPYNTIGLVEISQLELDPYKTRTVVT